MKYDAFDGYTSASEQMEIVIITTLQYILLINFLVEISLFHCLGLGKISNIAWNLSMSLGGSKAAFELTNLI